MNINTGRYRCNPDRKRRIRNKKKRKNGNNRRFTHREVSGYDSPGSWLRYREIGLGFFTPCCRYISLRQRCGVGVCFPSFILRALFEVYSWFLSCIMTYICGRGFLKYVYLYIDFFAFGRLKNIVNFCMYKRLLDVPCYSLQIPKVSFTLLDTAAERPTHLAR